MGTVISTESNVKENELLMRLSGKEIISDNDPFWNNLFSFNFTIDESKRANQKEFYEELRELFEFFLFNSGNTGNFATLIKVFLRRATELDISVKCDNKIFIWQTSNSLIILRYLFTFFLQRMSEAEFVHQFNHAPEDDKNEDDGFGEESDETESNADSFLTTLVDIVVDIPVDNLTASVHAEAIRCLLVLISPQLFDEVVSEDVYFLKKMMKITDKAQQLTKILLQNVIYQTTKLPTEIKEEQAESLVLSIASSLWSSFSKSMSMETPPEPEPDELGVDIYPVQTLSNLSAGLLMTLVCYNRFNGDVNAFKLAIEKCQNSQEVSSRVNPDVSFTVDFTDLYNRFCETATEPLPMLLLYMLIHRNSGFKNFVLARINLENLVLPIIKALNDGISAQSFKSTCRHTYLAMIVLLILSEDNFFCKIVHETVIKTVDWYQPDKNLPEITLGGLIVLVCVKTVHLNTVRMRDRYLHQNCLAALANMSSGYRDLSSFVCQKIIGLLETMTRRHSKLIQMLRDNAEECEDVDDSQGFDLHQDISALEEGIRTVLEMINACLITNLRHNSHLVYSILYNRQLFEQFHNHPMFQDLVWNIYLVINHFATVVQDAKAQSVDEVQETVAKAALQWPTDRLKRFPELKFKYVEDENTVDFFVPYVWRLICKSNGIYFPSETIKLFQINN